MGSRRVRHDCSDLAAAAAEGEEREKGSENISEDIRTENFPNLERK